MKKLSYITALGLAFFLLCVSSDAAFAQSAPARKLMAPLEPADLLKLLPAAPAGWQMKDSKATSFYNEWLVSQATRRFEGPPPPAAAGSKASNPPVTTIRLSDTGYSSFLYADFEDFKPGKYGENQESLYVASLPARHALIPNGERLRVLIRGRFIIEVEATYQKPEAAAGWVQLFDLRRLQSAPDTGVETLPNPVRVNSIDELNPRANSSYEISWSTEKDLEEARKRTR